MISRTSVSGGKFSGAAEAGPCGPGPAVGTALEVSYGDVNRPTNISRRCEPPSKSKYGANRIINI